jgi:hypothetical protein
MCETVVEEMSGGSFQSVERLYEVCNVFGLDPHEAIGPREAELKAALQARNMIVHEMDVDLSQQTRTGRPRSPAEVREHVTALLEAARDILETADERLAHRGTGGARRGQDAPAHLA